MEASETLERLEGLEPEEPKVEEAKPKRIVRIREARIYDIPQLVDLMEEFIEWQRKKGNKVYAEGDHLRGGIIIEFGAGFYNNMWKILVAERGSIIIGFIIAVFEHCSAVEKFTGCVKIKASYMKDDSLSRPRILRTLWEKVEEWGRSKGAGYFYGLIHPGNLPSIKTAKEVGFKHHTTQFLRLAQEETEE